MISTAKTARPLPAPSDAGPDEEADDPLPFSVELGAAHAFGPGFAVSGLRSEQGATRAFAALLVDGTGKLVDLGAVHGDPEPPLLVAHGARLLSLVIDSDAGGFVLRLGEIVDAKGNARFVQAAELSGIPRDANGFVADLSEGRGLFAYTGARDKTAIFVGSFDPAALQAKLSSRALTLTPDDASEPRIVARRGGFWLAFVSEPRPKKAPKLARAERDAGDDQPEKLVELGPRELRIVSLDGGGNPQGEPRRVAPPSNRPFMFDLAADTDTGALLLWQESQAPGADGAGIKLGRGRADGSLEQASIDDERLGAGVPSLLHDPEPETPAGALWLSAAGADDLTLFGAIGTGQGGTLQTDPLVRSSALLAANRGTLLVAQWRGQDVELRLIACTPPLSPAPP